MSETRVLVEEVLSAVPLVASMTDLVHPLAGQHPMLVKRIEDSHAPAEVKAGLFLLIDELDKSHGISQALESPTGSYWHGVMHRREGDFSNAIYWFHRAGKHPFLSALPGFDPEDFVHRCRADKGQNRPELVDLQRKEWKGLMDWLLTIFG